MKAHTSAPEKGMRAKGNREKLCLSSRLDSPRPIVVLPNVTDTGKSAWPAILGKPDAEQPLWCEPCAFLSKVMVAMS